MSQLNAYQKELRKTIAIAIKGVKGVASVYADTLVRYSNEDSHSCDNIQFLLNELKPLKRTQTAARKLLPMYVPVLVKEVKGSFVVTNRKSIPAEKKAELAASCLELQELDLSSLLMHPSLKVEVGFDWSKRQKSFKTNVKQLVENGVTADQMLGIIQSVCDQVALDAAEEGANSEANAA